MPDPYLIITAHGPPQAKKRHRSRLIYPRGGKPFIHEYPDPDTVKYETWLANEARVAMMQGRKRMLVEPCSLLVEAGHAVPPSWSPAKRQRALDGFIFPTSPRQADWDNLGKVTDAFNRIVWRDDKLVVMAQVHKFYAEQPFWRATVWRWFDDFVPYEEGDD